VVVGGLMVVMPLTIRFLDRRTIRRWAGFCVK